MAVELSSARHTPDGPSVDGATITPNDSADLSPLPRALYIGGAGNVSVDTFGGTESLVFVGAQAGSIIPMAVRRVNATGTTATDIVAMY
ncbi:MAG: hypothetical protein AB8B85_01660 [Paracoccaceae bacterium]